MPFFSLPIGNQINSSTASLSFSPIWNFRLKLSMVIRGFFTGGCMEILKWSRRSFDL